MSMRFKPTAAAKAMAEFIRLILGRSIIRIVSPTPTKAFNAQAAPITATHKPPRWNAGPKIVMIAPPARARTTSAGSNSMSIHRARYP